MPNTHVFTGLDGAISVAVESGVEGDAAKAVNDTYSLTPVGRATGVRSRSTRRCEPFHELGQRYATELRPGNVNISGTIGRAHINGALLQADARRRGAGGSRPGGRVRQPVVQPQPADGERRLARQHVDGHGARRQARRLGFSMPEDDFVHGAGRLQGAVDQRRGRGRREAAVTLLSADELLLGSRGDAPSSRSRRRCCEPGGRRRRGRAGHRRAPAADARRRPADAAGGARRAAR